MIQLHGNLKKMFGASINCKVRSVRELLQAAEAMRPGFRAAIDKDRNYIIRRGTSFKKGKDISEKELEMNFKDTDWHVIACPMGYKSGIFTTIFGAVLFVVGVYFGQTWLMRIGVAVMLSGVSSMLAPTPQTTNYANREDPDKKPSYLFNGPLNRTEAGGAVPLVYGKDVFIGSIFTSGGLETGDIA